MTQSKLDSLRERARAYRANLSPSVESSPERFQIKRWFETICENRDRLGEAIDYFKTAIEDGRPYITAMGNLEYMLAETPGLEHYYKGVLVDAEQIRKWLEALSEVTTARRAKHYMFDPDVRRKFGELKPTEIGKMVKADEEVVRLDFEIRMIANVENHLRNLVEGFTTRNINLSKIVEIRKAKLEEVWIDPTKGTENV